MKKLYVLSGTAMLAVAIGAVTAYIRHHNLAVLSPAGTIAAQERDLMIIATILMLVVVVPVFILTATIAWKYREGNTKAKYTPDWDHSRLAESIWWGFPLIIILILSVITWRSSHSLDPFQPISAQSSQMTIQVVALDWKWLFIYPEQNIATTNLIHIPEKTPIQFEITADAPMNSFWIPRLGGQIYAMAGMSTHLHLMANSHGTYEGSSANLSGQGFADMKFVAISEDETAFKMWVNNVKQSRSTLNQDSYTFIAKPGTEKQPRYYASVSEGLYNSVLEKYMIPAHGSGTHHHHEMQDSL